MGKGKQQKYRKKLTTSTCSELVLMFDPICNSLILGANLFYTGGFPVFIE